jgi:hypothetical protein
MNTQLRPVETIQDNTLIVSHQTWYSAVPHIFCGKKYSSRIMQFNAGACGSI